MNKSTFIDFMTPTKEMCNLQKSFAEIHKKTRWQCLGVSCGFLLALTIPWAYGVDHMMTTLPNSIVEFIGVTGLAISFVLLMGTLIKTIFDFPYRKHIKAIKEYFESLREGGFDIHGYQFSWIQHCTFRMPNDKYDKLKEICEYIETECNRLGDLHLSTRRLTENPRSPIQWEGYFWSNQTLTWYGYLKASLAQHRSCLRHHETDDDYWRDYNYDIIFRQFERYQTSLEHDKAVYYRTCREYNIAPGICDKYYMSSHDKKAREKFNIPTLEPKDEIITDLDTDLESSFSKTLKDLDNYSDYIKMNKRKLKKMDYEEFERIQNEYRAHLQKESNSHLRKMKKIANGKEEDSSNFEDLLMERMQRLFTIIQIQLNDHDTAVQIRNKIQTFLYEFSLRVDPKDKLPVAAKEFIDILWESCKVLGNQISQRDNKDKLDKIAKQLPDIIDAYRQQLIDEILPKEIDALTELELLNGKIASISERYQFKLSQNSATVSTVNSSSLDD